MNACSHRGANVCRKRKGNAKLWTCPYHGWVFDNQGTLLDVKNEAGGAYPADFDKADYGLTPVPHVAVLPRLHLRQPERRTCCR